MTAGWGLWLRGLARPPPYPLVMVVVALLPALLGEGEPWSWKAPRPLVDHRTWPRMHRRNMDWPPSHPCNGNNSRQALASFHTGYSVVVVEYVLWAAGREGMGVILLCWGPRQGNQMFGCICIR